MGFGCCLDLGRLPPAIDGAIEGSLIMRDACCCCWSEDDLPDVVWTPGNILSIIQILVDFLKQLLARFKSSHL